MKEAGEFKRLTDYILGNLPESDQVRLEEEYLTNQETQDKLLTVEDDLVDAYLEGYLSLPERKQLEEGFLALPRGQRKLELAKSLMKLASGESRPLQAADIELATARVPKSRRPKPSGVFSMQWVVAAAAMGVMFVLGWSIKEWRRPTFEPVKEQQNGSNRPKSGPAVPASDTPQTAGGQPSQSPAPQSPVIASLILKPMGRGAERSPRIRIPRGALQLQVQLDIEADNHKSYQGTLLSAGEDVKWSVRGLKTRPTLSGRGIVLNLPASLFESGEYTFLLSPDEDGARPIAEYSFVVQTN